MENINYFYQKDVAGELILVDGKPVEIPQPQATDINELRDMIAKGKPQKAIATYTQLVADNENWGKYLAYKKDVKDYEAELADVQAYNENPELDEDGEPILKEVPTPLEPFSFEPITFDDVRARVALELFAQNRAQREAEIAAIKVPAETDGETFYLDGDERSQVRMDRAARLMKEMNVPTYNWKCADNVWRDLTAEQFNQAIFDAGNLQTEIMQRYE